MDAAPPEPPREPKHGPAVGPGRTAGFFSAGAGVSSRLPRSAAVREPSWTGVGMQRSGPYPKGARSATFRAAVVLTFLLFAFFAAVLGASILRARSDAEETARNRAAAAAQVVATNARWIVELSRQALGRMDSALGADIAFSSPSTSLNLAEAVASLPGIARSYVVAADGRTLFTTDENWQAIDVRDREYFSAVADGERFHISSLLVSRLNDAQIFVFSRRLERGGAFVGAAIISFDMSLLLEVWQSLSLDGLSAVSFMREDGQLVARFPFAASPLDLGDHDLFTKHLRAADSGTYYSPGSHADGVTRIVGYRKVEGTPLVAVASISTQAAYRPFWRNTAITLLLAVPTALALAAAIIWILRLLRNDERRRWELEEALEHNRMLVRDTHHRVKNNLQAIMSLVRLHPVPDGIKADLQGRVGAMTEVHEHLYRLDRFSEIEASTLIPAIVDRLAAALSPGVSIEYDIDPLPLDRDQATPLALIVNEVVTNALKYAFPEGKAGTIRIGLKAEPGETVRLTIADDGVGFDHAAARPGLGTRLVKAMLRQLEAEPPHYAGEGGTTVTVRFRAVRPAGADGHAYI